MFDILIVDDEQPARDRLRRLIEAMPDYRVAGEAGSGAEALEKIRELGPDILLLDISMPVMDGMALARALQDSGAAPGGRSSTRQSISRRPPSRRFSMSRYWRARRSSSASGIS